MQQKPQYVVVRVVELRLQFLTAPDSWDDLSPASWVTDDREAAYQTARRLGGLLVRADGIPSADTVKQFCELLWAAVQSDGEAA